MIRRQGEQGMVTAEAAVIAPFLVTLVFAGVWVVSLGTTQAAAHAAAHEAARLIARGEPVAAAEQAARKNAPNARVEVDQHSSEVTVTVTTRAEAPVFSGVGVDVAARANARLEAAP